MEKERIEWVDILKFLGIFAIYLGHLGSIPNNIRNFVFNYHVPLFFFISGFFNKRIEVKEYIFYVKNSFKKYMYPYYFFALITLIYISIRNNSFNFNDFIYFITGIRNHVWGGLWFFSCLFTIKIIYNLILVIFKNKFIVFTISIFLYITSMKYLPHIPIMNPKWIYNVDSAFFYIIFYSLGDILFNNLKRNYQSKYYIILYYISILVAFDLYFGTNHFKIYRFLLENTDIFNFIFIGMFLISFNILLSIFLIKLDFFKDIGKETMILCGTETIGKMIFEDILLLFGITLKIINPTIAMIETGIILYLIYKFIVPICKKYV